MNHAPAFPFHRAGLSARTVMYCFHHAGGSAAAYRSWVGGSPDLTVVPVELPGKASRSREPFPATFADLVPDLAGAIAGHAGRRRVVLYGHSMGAALAFEVGARLETMTAASLGAVVVAARQPPDQIVAGEYHSSMGLGPLRDEMARVGGTPAEVLADDEVMGFLLTGIHRDYVLHESYQPSAVTLRCPVLAHAGSDDPVLRPEVMDGWAAWTSGPCVRHDYPGGHFFPLESDNRYLSDLVAELQALLEHPAPAPSFTAYKE